MNFWNLVFSICMFSVGVANFVLLALIVSNRLPRKQQPTEKPPKKTRTEKEKPESKTNSKPKHKDSFYDKLLEDT